MIQLLKISINTKVLHLRFEVTKSYKSSKNYYGKRFLVFFKRVQQVPVTEYHLSDCLFTGKNKNIVFVF